LRDQDVTHPNKEIRDGAPIKPIPPLAPSRPMVHTKSKTKATQIVRETKDALKARAVALYQHEQGKELQRGEKRMSLRTVCHKIEEEHKIDTGKEGSVIWKIFLVTDNTPACSPCVRYQTRYCICVRVLEPEAERIQGRSERGQG